MLTLVLLQTFLGKVWEVLADHLAVAIVVALILLAVSFFRQRLIDLSAWFVHISIYGKWDTTLWKQNITDIEFSRDKSPSPHETAHLHQFLTKVWGHTKRKDDSGIVYRVSGRIIGEKLALVYQEIGGFDAGAILLTIKSKKLMAGYEVGCKLDDVACSPEQLLSPPDQGPMYIYPYLWQKREND